MNLFQLSLSEACNGGEFQLLMQFVSVLMGWIHLPDDLSSANVEDRLQKPFINSILKFHQNCKHSLKSKLVQLLNIMLRLLRSCLLSLFVFFISARRRKLVNGKIFSHHAQKFIRERKIMIHFQPLQMHADSIVRIVGGSVLTFVA
jgi:hypothetical protein